VNGSHKHSKNVIKERR